MSDDRRVSVLLPVYFREGRVDAVEFLVRAIDSIHSQEFPSEYEILIVDDGSATAISSLTPLFGMDRLRNVRFIRLFRNYGLVHALNRGLCEARYPWVARIDADDSWCTGKIEKQFSLLTYNENITIAATGMTRMDPIGNEIDVHIRPGDWKGVLKFFVEIGCPFPHGSVLARTDIYRLLGGYSHNPEFSHCEDFALWGIWLRFFMPAMVEESLYNYTVSEGSVTGLHAEQQLKATKAVIKTFKDLELIERLPEVLSALCSALGCSLIEAGVVAYKIWRFGPAVLLPQAALDALELLLPDRRLLINAGTNSPLEIGDLTGRHMVPKKAGRLLEVRAI